MQQFTSVVSKSSNKLAPKPGPRRNAKRVATRNTTLPKDGLPTPTSQSSTPPESDHESLLSQVEIDKTRSELQATEPQLGRFAQSIQNETGRHSDENVVPSVETTLGSSLGAQGEERRRLDVLNSSRVENVQASEAREEARAAPMRQTRGTKRRVLDSATEDHQAVVASSASPISGVSSQSALPRKKRKIAAPEPSPSHILAHGKTSTTIRDGQIESQPGRPTSSTPLGSRAVSETTNSLLESATASAAAVSDLASDIESNTKASRPLRRDHRSSAVVSKVSGTDLRNTQAPAKTKKKTRKPKTIGEAAAEVVAAAVGISDVVEASNTRHETPEGAEEHQIAPREVKMGELTKDSKMGRKSGREAEMQKVDWDNQKRLWRLEREDQLRRKQSQGRGKNQPDAELPAAKPQAPIMEIVDGQIVINEDSRLIDRSRVAEDFAANPDAAPIEERSITRRINSSTVGGVRGLGPGYKWNEEMNDLFYKGIRMFGTDFMLISSLFPGMTRRHIKHKYVREEKTNYTRLQQNLANREDVDLDDYQSRTEKTYGDPDDVYAELEAEKQRIIAKDDERKALEDQEQEHEEQQERESTVLPSHEQSILESEEQVADGREETAGSEVDSSVRENRFSAAARRVVKEASGPKRKRKQTSAPRKKETPKRGRRPMEGVEERLGPIDEVAR